MRNRATAIMVRNGEILMARFEDDGRTIWYLPGGGIEAGETPEQALVREVREELNLDVDSYKLLYIYPLPDASGTDYGFLVSCDGIPIMGNDPGMVEIAWRPLSDISLFTHPAPALLALREQGKG